MIVWGYYSHLTELRWSAIPIFREDVNTKSQKETDKEWHQRLSGLNWPKIHQTDENTPFMFVKSVSKQKWKLWVKQSMTNGIGT